MKSLGLFLVFLAGALISSGCHGGTNRNQTSQAALEAGALYVLNDGEGGYRAGKIIALEEDVTFMQLYVNRWVKRPALAEVRLARDAAPIAFTAQTLAGMQPVLLSKGNVSEAETEAYQTWKESKREMF